MNNELPSPVSRSDMYDLYLTGKSGLTIEDLPSPVSRSDMYRYYLCVNGVIANTNRSRYGVRKPIISSNPELERVGDAVGLIAEIDKGDGVYRNDFENIYPYNAIRICILSDTGEVLAYKGEPHFNVVLGQVMVEFPKFYIKYEVKSGYEYWWVSANRLDGFRLPPCFINKDGSENNHYYIGVYEASIDKLDSNKIASVSGAIVEVIRTINQFRTLAKVRGTGWHLMDIASVCDILQHLFYIQFATLNTQRDAKGVTECRYASTDRPTMSENNVNRVVTTNAVAGYYEVGQMIDIGTSQGGRQIAKNREILAIEVVDSSNKAIVFDGAPVNVTTEHYLYNVAFKTGATDSIQSLNGMAAGTNGKKPIKFLGIENPFGNTWTFIDGANIKDRQAYVCCDPEEYGSDKFDGAYKKLGYVNQTSEGYLKRLGYDEQFGWARLPIEVGAASTTWHCDYYYNQPGNRVALLGGRWSNGASAGLSYWALHNASSNAYLDSGARLSYKPC